MFSFFRGQGCSLCSAAVLHQKFCFPLPLRNGFATPAYITKQTVMKSRNKTKVRKVNLSSKLRAEFNKHKNETPIIACRRMEFNFYEGMKYGKFEPVPLASKGWSSKGSNGDYFYLYEKSISSNDLHFGNIRPPTPISRDILNPASEELDFSRLGLDAKVIQPLKKFGVKKPADIQVAAIPHILQGKNCIVSAHTGCGKTFAYLLPILQMVLKSSGQGSVEGIPLNSPKVLILTPSRELSQQIYRVLQQLLENFPLKAKLLIGGWKSDDEDESFKGLEVVDFLVGSLGTVKKEIKAGRMNLERINHIVLDESDQLADDLNFRQIKQILKSIPIRQPIGEGLSEDITFTSGAQLILASATTPINLNRLFEDVINVDSFERISSLFLHDVLKNVPQLFLKVGKIHKGKTLIDLVEKDVKMKRPVMIFCNKIVSADWVSIQLSNLGFTCKNLTSSVPTEIRKYLFEDFQKGEFDILSTTPMAARGLDTVRVQHIINFEFPLYVSEYIHQIGRVGRIGSSNTCHVTNIVTHQREIELVQKIELSVRLGDKLSAVSANIPGILRNRHNRFDEPEE